MAEMSYEDGTMHELPLSRVHQLGDFEGILYDLDRCPHGRHEGDACAGWQPDQLASGCRGGVSLGNPNIHPGQVIGYGIDRRKIVMPTRDRKHDPANWRPRD